jgi:hypothetical protein
MAATRSIDDGPDASAAGPALSFAVERVAALRPAAAPTLRFTLRVDADGAAVRSVVLGVQIQIAASRRRYDAAEQELLADVFGAPQRWGETLHALPWTRATLAVPPFEATTLAELDVPCTYDFEVTATRYLAALGDDGEVPLELLFSGTVFTADGDGRLQAGRIAWDREARCRLPVHVWREALDAHFAGATWMRLERATFERLVAYRARNALVSWETTLAALLASEGTA